VKAAATIALRGIRRLAGELACRQFRSEIIHGRDKMAVIGRGGFCGHCNNQIQRMDPMRSLLMIGALALGIISAATPAQAAGVRMFVRHEVTDYATWRKSYDAFGATQKDMGVGYQAVYRSTDDKNDITVVHVFKTVEKAKAFVNSDKLKAAMQESGVKGAPTIWYTNVTPGSSGKPGHVRMFVRHDVADYTAWRKSYDAFGATQKKLGVTAQAVYQSTDNPNDVTATHDFASVEKARAFAASPELKWAMEDAGVKGVPQIWFTTRASK
jgi:hypothetical protein